MPVAFAALSRGMIVHEAVSSMMVLTATHSPSLNGETVGRKLRAEDGTLRRLLRAGLDDDRLVEELYLTALSRPPTERERQRGRDLLRGDGARAEAAADLLWALLVGQEFLFNH